MHRGHDHDEGGAAGASGHGRALIGHNGQRGALQWQTPHLAESPPPPQETPELDQVERAFIESFPRSSEPESFLRLAGIPCSGRDGAGVVLHLLRVEIEEVTDVGALSPLFGGAGLRYAALSKHMVSRRRRLVFVYFDGSATRKLALGEARALDPGP